MAGTLALSDPRWQAVEQFLLDGRQLLPTTTQKPNRWTFLLYKAALIEPFILYYLDIGGLSSKDVSFFSSFFISLAFSHIRLSSRSCNSANYWPAERFESSGCCRWML